MEYNNLYNKLNQQIYSIFDRCNECYLHAVETTSLTCFLLIFFIRPFWYPYQYTGANLIVQLKLQQEVKLITVTN